jgi:hypothetical protein
VWGTGAIIGGVGFIADGEIGGRRVRRRDGNTEFTEGRTQRAQRKDKRKAKGKERRGK